MIIQHKTYTRACKEDNWNIIQKIENNNISISDKFKDKLYYLNYDVCLTYEIDTDKETIKLISKKI